MQNESNLKVRELFSIPLLKMKVWEDTEELNDCDDYILSTVSYTHIRAHETREDRGCRVLG